MPLVGLQCVIVVFPDLLIILTCFFTCHNQTHDVFLSLKVDFTKYKESVGISIHFPWVKVFRIIPRVQAGP